MRPGDTSTWALKKKCRFLAARTIASSQNNAGFQVYISLKIVLLTQVASRGNADRYSWYSWRGANVKNVEPTYLLSFKDKFQPFNRLNSQLTYFQPIWYKETINMMGVFAENLVGLGFLQSVSYIKPNPSDEKVFCCGKTWPQMPLLTWFFPGLGWRWVG